MKRSILVVLFVLVFGNARFAGAQDLASEYAKMRPVFLEVSQTVSASQDKTGENSAPTLEDALVKGLKGLHWTDEEIRQWVELSRKYSFGMRLTGSRLDLDVDLKSAAQAIGENEENLLPAVSKLLHLGMGTFSDEELNDGLSKEIDENPQEYDKKEWTPVTLAILEEMFIRRGASLQEAQQQVMLKRKYGVHAVVTMEGRITAFAIPQALIDRILSENKGKLAPKIEEYLRNRDFMTPWFEPQPKPKPTDGTSKT